jgi:hypothetical protein
MLTQNWLGIQLARTKAGDYDCSSGKNKEYELRTSGSDTWAPITRASTSPPRASDPPFALEWQFYPLIDMIGR